MANHVRGFKNRSTRYFIIPGYTPYFTNLSLLENDIIFDNFFFKEIFSPIINFRHSYLSLNERWGQDLRFVPPQDFIARFRPMLCQVEVKENLDGETGIRIES